MAGQAQNNRRSSLIRKIHIGKAQIGLSEDSYRALLFGTTGKESCKDMSLFELDETLGALKKLGFRVRGKSSPLPPVNPQVDYIKRMWKAVARVKTDTALNSFITRLTGISAYNFLDKYSAQKVILALRKMSIDAGLDPEKLKRKYG